MNISLTQLVKNGEFKETGAKPKLPIKIEELNSSLLDVYQIPLKYLFYNDENGRIASEMEKERIDLEPVADSVNSEYNDQIAKLIRKDNPSKLNRTKKDIEKDGQKVFGYVLDDGRIIDGNRRFTALRELQNESGKSGYFEAVILPFSYDKKVDRQRIKSLELAIQMGVEERQDYDLLDKAVDIYRTTADENLFTISDYAEKASMKKKEVKDNFDAVLLIRDFLDFIGMSQDSYYLIKETGTYTVFLEMTKTLRTTFGKGEDSEVNKNETKLTFFVWVLSRIGQGAGGTMAYEGRDYKKNIIKKRANNEFNAEVEDIVDDIQEDLSEREITGAASLSKAITSSKDSFEDFNDIYDEYLDNAKKDENIDSFIKDITKIAKQLKDVKSQGGLRGTMRFEQLSNNQKEALQRQMREILITSEDLFEEYKNA
ncbi:hypothetical protein [Ligilactobacillus hohenheimensis]|uniref:hypothetical protein n=1 Tax=Ligilactobacillus hohenheimensis TaxID=2991832 RepID=UPI0024BAA53F|nr:hypothetical protein [Ligilactobacillus hohenheimensis]